jgi:hypothetical protein
MKIVTTYLLIALLGGCFTHTSQMPAGVATPSVMSGISDLAAIPSDNHSTPPPVASSPPPPIAGSPLANFTTLSASVIMIPMDNCQKYPERPFTGNISAKILTNNTFFAGTSLTVKTVTISQGQLLLPGVPVGSHIRLTGSSQDAPAGLVVGQEIDVPAIVGTEYNIGSLSFIVHISSAPCSS